MFKKTDCFSSIFDVFFSRIGCRVSLYPARCLKLERATLYITWGKGGACQHVCKAFFSCLPHLEEWEIKELLLNYINYSDLDLLESFSVSFKKEAKNWGKWYKGTFHSALTSQYIQGVIELLA